MKVHEVFSKACDFYKVFVGSVEIAREHKQDGPGNNQKKLYKLYFPKNYMSKFITENIRQSIISDKIM